MCPARDRPRLSPKQEQVLEFIRQITATKGYAPSIREIGDAVGLRSTSSVAHQIRALEGKGYLRSIPNGPRTSVVTLPTESTKPVVKENSGPPRQLRGCPDIFLQRMTGKPLSHGPQGMIIDGDLLVVKRQHTAADGDLAAVLNKGRPVLAPVRKNDAGRRFMEANPDAVRMDDAVLLGVVVAVTSDC
ncbi:hypothetical protein ACFRK5_21395 [Streptomyces niveus]|uniref:LexA family protein n=1 Tax=Streptomyces niveus TaxID=193462 RepID=UPI0036A268E9